MLKNYFRIAIAVLKRRKFFTFISLFGISFSLTILVVVTAFIDNAISASYPDTNRHRSLYINHVGLRKQLHNGSHNWAGSGTFYFLDHYTSLLKTPAIVAIASNPSYTNTYVNNKKLSITVKYTNAPFWNVLNYEFSEGKSFDKQQVENAERVAVISEDLKEQYFGNTGSVVGKYLEADNVQYRIAGVVKNVSVTNFHVYADMYLPYTVSKSNYRDQSLIGEYNAIILANSAKDLPALKSEYNDITSRIPISKEWDMLITHADEYLETFTRFAFGGGTQESSGFTGLVIATAIISLLFFLLPTLNLVNINTSRILERASEIGVRKAFGASSKTLVMQFIIENIILTVLGGIISIILSFIVLQFINNSDLLPNTTLHINLTVLFFAFAACIVFGFLSGVYPAWRMSRLQVVDALKQV